MEMGKGKSQKTKEGWLPQATRFYNHKGPVTVQLWNKPMAFEQLLSAEFTNSKNKREINIIVFWTYVS